MAWNEPGGNSGGKRNPWGGNKPDQGPPDLDEVFRNLRRRFGGMFGGGRGATGGGGGASAAGSGFGFGVIVIALLAIWAFTGLYQVQAAERALILRFGKYVATTGPGLHWHLPWPIETRQIVNVGEIQSFDDQTRMLTADETLVDINLEVQYRRSNELDYAFNVLDPERTLEEVSESAIREIVGRSRLNDVLESGRQQIVMQTKELIQRTLDAYKAGLEVTSVNLQDVRVPTEVASAQQDAIKAREDRDRFSLAAQAYANDIIPRARGEAVRRVQDAHAYRARVIAEAEGEAQRFLKLLAEYEKAPAVTRERLYIETVEQVLASAKKVVLDTDGSGNLIYVPIDKLLEQGRRAPRPADAETSMTVEGSATMQSGQFESDRRTRGSR